MAEYSRPLGDAVKQKRRKLKLTQTQVADRADLDVRTVLNIENHKGNPKMEILYPLIRTLQLDPIAIFYPELAEPAPAVRRLQFLLQSCSNAEAETLTPVVEAVLQALRTPAAEPPQEEEDD